MLINWLIIIYQFTGDGLSVPVIVRHLDDPQCCEIHSQKVLLNSCRPYTQPTNLDTKVCFEVRV